MRTGFRRICNVVLFTLTAGFACAQDQAVYTDSIQPGWDNWSWATHNVANTSPVHSGARSVSVVVNNWEAFYLHSSAGIDPAEYDRIRFWVNSGSTANKQIDLAAQDATLNPGAPYRLPALPANTWVEITVPLSTLGVTYPITGFWWQSGTATNQGTAYLDDITLLRSTTAPPPPPYSPTITIDASSQLREISPDIYGFNFCPAPLADELDLTVNRWGGNATTRYNWENDVSNRARDWYFENIPESNPNRAALPVGSASDDFVQANQGTGTGSIVTMPMIGYTPKGDKLNPQMEGGFRVSKYGAQQSTDPWWPDFGNGRHPNGTVMTGNDPLDTSIVIDQTFVERWIRHLTGQFNDARRGGVKFYALDNEPELWSDTHRDVRPQHLGYDEERDRTILYADAIKATDPSAKTLGPVSWGWTAYFWSDLDTAPGGNWWQNPLDRNAHGGTPFNDWYLQQLQARHTAHGVRLLDYFDLHYYPTDVALESVGGTALQELRLRQTRSLWDPTYVDQSWIGEAVRLLPRMRDWVNTNYPGTKLAITEYNWGGLEHINGALAQADVLGIFGREGLDLATIWSPPTSTEPGAYAFRMYRNYDGQGRKFGEVSVGTVSSDQGKVSAYAARRRSDGAMTIMAINKTSTDRESTFSLTNFAAGGPVQVYTYSTANLNAIVRQPDLTATSGTFIPTVKGYSISLYVIPRAGTSGAVPVVGSVMLSDSDPMLNTAPTVRTNDRIVHLALSGLSGGAADFIHMSEQSNFATSTTVALIDGAVVPYTLSAGDGSKTVYVRLSNLAGLSNTVSAPILLDQTPPTTQVTGPTGTVEQRPTSLQLTCTGSDSGAGMQGMYIRYRRGGSGPFGPYSTLRAPFSTSVAIDTETTGGDGAYEFQTMGVDNAGNVEPAPATADVALNLTTGVPVTLSGWQID